MDSLVGLVRVVHWIFEYTNEPGFLTRNSDTRMLKTMKFTAVQRYTWVL
jgi:hypothetical protein